MNACVNSFRTGLFLALVALGCGCSDDPSPSPPDASPFATPSNPTTDAGDTTSDLQDGGLPTVSERGSAPAPPSAVAGIRGLRVDGRIEVVNGEANGDDGATAHTLRTTRRWVFPDRGRTDVTRPELGPAHRTRHQRFGGRLWFLAVGELEPVELSSTDRTDSEERRALDHVATDTAYRAALLWPDGFAWTDGSDGTRTADFDDSVAGALRLKAWPPTEGDETLVVDVLRDGELEEAVRLVHLVATGRFEHPTRRFPAALHVETEHGAWTETFERIDPRAFYLDALFEVGQPRAIEQHLDPGTTFVRIARVPERPWRRHPFVAPHRDLARAQERAAQLLAGLDPGAAGGADAVYELDEGARFTAVILRLAPDHDVPDGFEAARPGSALGIDVDPALAGEPKRALEALASMSTASSTTPGTPYLVQLASSWQVVLPLPRE